MKTLNKVNQKIYDLIKQTQEIGNYDAKQDFHIREGNVCGYVKIHWYLDADDVIKAYKKIYPTRVLTEDIRIALLTEFSDERLYSIINHTAEMEIESLRDYYKNDTVRTINYFKEYYEKGNAFNFDAYLFKIRSKSKTFQQFFQKAMKKERYKSAYIDSTLANMIEVDIYQYGRSGGFLSFCDKMYLEDQNGPIALSDSEERHMHEIASKGDNDAFNEFLSDQYFEVCQKSELIKEMKMFISNWKWKYEQILHTIRDIEASVKENGTFYRNCIEQLVLEISEFEFSSITEANTEIKVMHEDILRTTLGVSFNTERFLASYRQVKGILDNTPAEQQIIAINLPFSNYKIETAIRTNDDIIIKAGCHKFSFNKVQELYNVLC